MIKHPIIYELNKFELKTIDSNNLIKLKDSLPKCISVCDKILNKLNNIKD